jgi:hypothetical protein
LHPVFGNEDKKQCVYRSCGIVGCVEVKLNLNCYRAILEPLE